MKTEDAIALFASRADMYRQVAQWFFAPLSEEQIDALASQDLRGLAEEDGSPYADGYNDLYRALRLRHTGTRQALAADFTGCSTVRRPRAVRQPSPSNRCTAAMAAH